MCVLIVENFSYCFFFFRFGLDVDIDLLVQVKEPIRGRVRAIKRTLYPHIAPSEVVSRRDFPETLLLVGRLRRRVLVTLRIVRFRFFLDLGGF